MTWELDGDYFTINGRRLPLDASEADILAVIREVTGNVKGRVQLVTETGETLEPGSRPIPGANYQVRFVVEGG